MLTPGTLLGPYEVVSLLGKGGMGEVYKARDTRLNRDVAIKTSATQFSERFEREARAIASLNHPNICTLFDVGPNYLVMELVEGEPVQGPLPLDTALAYARQIASALEAAHERSITHRDLKPGNIMVTADGVIKVLDFGLAKIGQPSASDTNLENSPTLTMGATVAGAILGTAAYMAPEQARGKAVDKRADIWAFGVVLHEMITGERVFKGEDLTETLAAVVMRDPDLAPVPPQVRRLLKKCLQKDPKNRLRDIGDVWELLDTAPAASPSSLPAPAPPSKAPWAVAAVALLGLAALAAMHFTEQAAPIPTVRFGIVPPEGITFAGGPPRAAISPDGTQLAFNATQDGKTQMWVRRFDSIEAHLLPGTEGSETPFWSPDSKSVGFTSAGKLRRVDVASGTVQVLCDAPANDVGASWSSDGQTILFSGRNPDLPIQRVPASGGSPVAVLKFGAKESFQRWPRFLPDGRHFLYVSTGKAAKDDAIYAGDLQGGEPKRLVDSSTLGEFASGYLLYRAQESLVARAFDPSRLEFTGEPVQVAASVTALDNGRAGFSVSANGYLAVHEAGNGGGATHTLNWVDRFGRRLKTLGQPGTFGALALSRDGRQLAYHAQASGPADVWIFDLVREVPTRVTFDKGPDARPVWSADGRDLLFDSARGGKTQIYKKSASGLGEEQLLFPSTEPVLALDVSVDGQFLLFGKGNPAQLDVYVLPLAEKKGEIPVLTSPFLEHSARFSPDGRWIAYTSNESGSFQIYVRTFPGSERKIQVSTGGGLQPRWRADGKELYFLGADGNMMAVPIKTAPAFEPGTPVSLFPAQLPVVAGRADYVVAPDGSRFLMNLPIGATAQTPITIVQNWPALLQK